VTTIALSALVSRLFQSCGVLRTSGLLTADCRHKLVPSMSALQHWSHAEQPAKNNGAAAAQNPSGERWMRLQRGGGCTSCSSQGPACHWNCRWSDAVVKVA
jgi:hypothetical protein